MSNDTPQPLDVAAIASRASAAIAEAGSTGALNEVETEFLGKRSVMSEAHRSLGQLDETARKEAGRQLHELRASIETQIATRRTELEADERAAYLIADRLDLTEVIPAHIRSPLA